MQKSFITSTSVLMKEKENSIESETNFPLLSSSVSDIYYAANTPYFLYCSMRENQAVIELSAMPNKLLIDEFNKRTTTTINTNSQLAEIYAIYISLTLKQGEDVVDFFKEAIERIKFEWFGEIAKIFLSTYKNSSIFQTINIPSSEPSIQIIYPNRQGESIKTPQYFDIR